MVAPAGTGQSRKLAHLDLLYEWRGLKDSLYPPLFSWLHELGTRLEVKQPEMELVPIQDASLMIHLLSLPYQCWGATWRPLLFPAVQIIPLSQYCCQWSFVFISHCNSSPFLTLEQAWVPEESPPYETHWAYPSCNPPRAVSGSRKPAMQRESKTWVQWKEEDSLHFEITPSLCSKLTGVCTYYFL